MAKNHMEDIAKMLGLELDEEFKVTDDFWIYRLTKNGMQYYGRTGWHSEAVVFLKLLSGKTEIIKLPRQPKEEIEASKYTFNK